jgi:hypothetical protein
MELESSSLYPQVFSWDNSAPTARIFIKLNIWVFFKFYVKNSKNTQILNFIKIRAVGAELFHENRWRTDGQTLTNDTANSSFPQFTERTKSAC